MKNCAVQGKRFRFIIIISVSYLALYQKEEKNQNLSPAHVEDPHCSLQISFLSVLLQFRSVCRGPHLNTWADSELCPTAALCQSLPVDVCWFLIGTDSCILRDRNITSIKNSTFCLSANTVGNLTKLINMTVDGNKTYVSPSEEYFKWVRREKKTQQTKVDFKLKFKGKFSGFFYFFIFKCP